MNTMNGRSTQSAQRGVKYASWLLGFYAALFVWLAFDVHNRFDWFLENLLPMALVIALIVTRRRYVFTRISYTCIFVYMCLHTIGSHYTYSLVPYDRWFESLFGMTLNGICGWQRNHYDRLIHFAYGLLFAYPLRELLLHATSIGRTWGFVLAAEIIMSTSMLYEVLEWWVAAAFGGDIGTAFNGTQGDQWDAQKDMALATLGAICSMGGAALIWCRTGYDPAAKRARGLRTSRRRHDQVAAPHLQ